MNPDGKTVSDREISGQNVGHKFEERICKETVEQLLKNLVLQPLMLAKLTIVFNYSNNKKFIFAYMLLRAMIIGFWDKRLLVFDVIEKCISLPVFLKKVWTARD